MATGNIVPDEAVLLMKLALGMIDTVGGGRTVAACHLNSAIETAMRPERQTYRVAIHLTAHDMRG